MFNVPVTVMLVRRNLLSLSHLDVSLARQIIAGKPLAVEFLADLIREMVSSDLPIAYRCDFASSLAAVGQLLATEPNHKVAQMMVAELRATVPIECITDDPLQLRYIFTEWIRLYLHVQTNEKSFAAFAYQLNQIKVISDTATYTSFLRICIEASITEFEAVENEVRVRDTRVDQGYVTVDALARLIVTIVKYHTEEDNNLTRAELIRSTLSLVVVMFNHHHESNGDNFPQKLYFRLFSSLLYEFRQAQKDLESSHEGILLAFRYLLFGHYLNIFY